MTLEYIDMLISDIEEELATISEKGERAGKTYQSLKETSSSVQAEGEFGKYIAYSEAKLSLETILTKAKATRKLL